MGQEKPRVAAPKPRVVSWERFQWGVGIRSGKGVEVRFELSRDDFGGPQVVVRPDQGSLPLTRGQLEATVQEMERGLQEGAGGELSALDAVEKTVMKLRRLLAVRGEPGEESSKIDEVSPARAGELYPVWSPGGHMLFYHGRNGELIAVEREPIFSPGPQGIAERVVLHLRRAGNVEEARQALDEVEKSVITLRVLLWEGKGSKRE